VETVAAAAKMNNHQGNEMIESFFAR